jgi:hypothetical protein
VRVAGESYPARRSARKRTSAAVRAPRRSPVDADDGAGIEANEQKSVIFVRDHQQRLRVHRSVLAKIAA